LVTIFDVLVLSSLLHSNSSQFKSMRIVEVCYLNSS
jgi:hypothetical protein